MLREGCREDEVGRPEPGWYERRQRFRPLQPRGGQVGIVQVVRLLGVPHDEDSGLQGSDLLLRGDDALARETGRGHVDPVVEEYLFEILRRLFIVNDQPGVTV